MKEKSQQSLGDLAKALAVSRSTVSRALRNDTRISAATRERVQEFARVSGYQPDPLVSRLAAHAWRKRRGQGDRVNIAYLAMGRSGSNLEASLRFQGARAYAEPLGYGTELLNLAQFSEPAQLARVAYARGVRGLICGFSASNWLAEAKDFPWERFVTVAAGVNTHRLPLHTVSINGVASVELALGKLRAQGYRRIGLAALRFGELSEMDLQKNGSFLVRQAEWPEAERIPVWTGGPSETESLAAWVRNEEPDVVLGSVGSIRQMLLNGGIATPEQVPFAGLYLHESKEPGSPGITSGGGRVGRAAMSLLDALLQRNETGLPAEPFRVMVEPEWQEGATPEAA